MSNNVSTKNILTAGALAGAPATWCYITTTNNNMAILNLTSNSRHKNKHNDEHNTETLKCQQAPLKWSNSKGKSEPFIHLSCPVSCCL